MSDNNLVDLRKILSQRPLDKTAADYFLEHSPGCQCEGAEAVPGGHGPVSDLEILSMYLGSPRHYRERYQDQKTIEKEGFPYKSNLFDAIFLGGLSLMREEKATSHAISIQAEKIANGLRNDNPKGGLFSVLQFFAGTVRAAFDEKERCRHFCIYDTPIDCNIAGQEVFAHADIFPAGPKGSTASALRTARRVKIRQVIASLYQEIGIQNYRENILSKWQEEPSHQ